MSKTSKQVPDTQFCTVDTTAGPIMVPYMIRRSPRSGRIYISLDGQNRVLITIPSRGTIKSALRFLDQCGDWLVEQLSRAPRPKSLLKYLQDKPYLTLHGKRVRVVFGYTNRCPYYVYRREAAEVVLHYDFHSINEARIREALKSLAKDCIRERIDFLCETRGIRPPKRVTVRDQSTLWGSCTSTQHISLNWRLILLPAKIQDYVILHELAHLKQMNHSYRFWNLLSSYDPDCENNDRKLNEVSRSIINLGKET
ncbi:MAG: M48 family metallopeptidase [Verrucomicrobiae bacterium]|nr:M48 family metallopeptidase [Verrucomicrobiae bacterium]